MKSIFTLHQREEKKQQKALLKPDYVPPTRYNQEDDPNFFKPLIRSQKRLLGRQEMKLQEQERKRLAHQALVTARSQREAQKKEKARNGSSNRTGTGSRV